MEDVPLTGTLMGAANDPNDVRYFRIVTPPATGEVVELNRRTGAFRYVPEPNAFGAISFEYRLFDGQQLSPVVRASLDLASVNDLPTITGPSERQVLQGEALTFVVTAQDVEDGRLTVSAPTPLPAGASFDAGSGTFSWATTREQVGEHELRFAARDQGGAEAALVVTVNVTLNNAAPSLGQVEWEGTAAEGDALTLRAPATDEDGDVLTWTWDLGDGSPPQVTQGDTLEHLYAQDGSYAVSVTVSDGMREDTSSATLQITNLPPVPEAGPDLEGVVGEALGFAGSFTDLGAQDEHTILWDFGDGTQEPNAALTTSHAYAAPGVYTVTFAVSDELERARDTLTVTIREGAGTNNASTNNANNANNASANNSGANNSGVGGNNASANNSGEANNGDGGGEPTVGDGGCQSAPRGAGLGGLWWAALGAAWAWRRGRRLGAR
jgi:PKD repeat protein